MKRSNNFSRYLRSSQISLISLLVLCSLIMPSVARLNGGVSNYGNSLHTVVPYTLSFSLCALFLCLAAGSVEKKHRTIARLLVALAVVEVLVLISTFPRHLSNDYSEIHDYLAIGLFDYQLALSIWLYRKNRSRSVLLLLISELIGSVIGLLSIIKIIHFLFVAQLIGGVSFGILLSTSLPKVLLLNTKSRKN